MIRVAGANVPRVAMAELALELRDAGQDSLADRILAALNRGERRLSLSREERSRLLLELNAPPAGLEELHAVLLKEHVGRVRDGMI